MSGHVFFNLALKKLGIKAYGAQGQNRTADTVIFSHVLYQLSYLGSGVADNVGSGAL